MKNIPSILQFIDSTRFMASSLLNIVKKVSEGQLNVNQNMMIKNMKHAELNISIATVFLNAQILKMNIKNINF